MPYIDFHCDTLSRHYYGWNTDSASETLWENKGHIDLNRLIKTGYAAQFFACFIDRKSPSRLENHYLDVLAMTDLLKNALKEKDSAALALSYDDYLENRKQGRLSCFLTVEGGGIIENDPERLKKLHETGIRLITLTWNHENCLGFPSTMSSLPDTGLKSFGIETIREMERLKMLVDVSHLSDQGFEDVYLNTKRPFIASHSCCRSLCPHPRNLTDDMIRKIGERQGLVGMNYYGAFLSSDEKSTIPVIIRHLRHLINVGGLDIAALGSDFDGMDGYLELSRCEDMPLLVCALEKDGFTYDQIDAICYKNAERLLKLL